MSRRANLLRGSNESRRQTTLTGNSLKNPANRSSPTVEISDDDGDDDVKVHASPTRDEDEECLIVRRPRNRRRRREVQANWEDEQNGNTQEEERQLQEAIRQSQLDAQKDEERRAMCGDLDAFSKPEQIQKSRTERDTAESNKETESKLGLETSVIHPRGAASAGAGPNGSPSSPLLFAESEEIQAQDDTEQIEEFPDSPPVPVGSIPPAAEEALEADTATSQEETSTDELTNASRSRSDPSRRRPGHAKYAPGKIILARHYRQQANYPQTLADAVKARLYFAPLDFDVKQYVGVILRLFEISNTRLRTSQSQLLDKIEWSAPATPWPRVGNLELGFASTPTVRRCTDKRTVTSGTSTSLGSVRAVVKPTSKPTTPVKLAAPVQERVTADDSDDNDDAPLIRHVKGVRLLSWKERVAKVASEQNLPLKEGVSVPSPGRTPRSVKRKQNAAVDISDEAGEGKDDRPPGGEEEVAWLTAHPKKNGESPLKKCKLDENTTAGPGETPGEVSGAPTTPAENERRSGTPKPITKRSRKLSSDADEKTTAEPKETPREGSGAPSAPAENERRSGTPTPIAKRSRKLSSDADEKATAEPKETPGEGSGAPSTSAENERRSGTPKPITKRSRKLSSDSDQTDDERELDKTPASALRPGAATSNATAHCANTAEEKSAESRPSGTPTVSPRRAELISPMKANDRRSEAAARAAAAAERRLHGSAPVATESGAHRADAADEGVQVQCPMCFRHFARESIEAHASDCVGSSPPRATPPQTNPDSTTPRLFRTLTGESRELKELRVVLERSPVTKTSAQRTDASKSAVKSLSFTEAKDKDTRSRLRARDPKTADSSGPGDRGRSSKSPGKRRARPGPQQKKVRGPGADFWPLDSAEPTTSSAPRRAAGRSSACAVQEAPVARGDTDDSVERELLAQQRSKLQSKNENARSSWTLEDNENERALLQLAGLEKGGKTRRHGNAADESDSDEDEDDADMMCTMCKKRIPKAEYSEHVDRELQERQRHSSDSEEDTSSNPEEIEISSSPIKAFKLIGENTQIDYHNQFAHMANERGRGGKRKAPGGVGWWEGKPKNKKGRKRFKKWKKV